jgi:hypothetical protein
VALEEGSEPPTWHTSCVGLQCPGRPTSPP